MKKLVLAGLIVTLVGCGGEPEINTVADEPEVTAPVESEVAEVEPEETVVDAPVVETVVDDKAVVNDAAVAVETTEPVTRQDAESYMMKVEGAIDDAQRFNGTTDMDNFKNVQKRFTTLRDEGDIFLKGDYDNCGKLGMFPLEILWLRKDNENVEEKIGFYQEFYQSCQQQVNTTI